MIKMEIKSYPAHTYKVYSMPHKNFFFFQPSKFFFFSLFLLSFFLLLCTARQFIHTTHIITMGFSDLTSAAGKFLTTF